MRSDNQDVNKHMTRKQAIIQLVKAEENSTISNVVQQVFVGDYELLRDAYLHPWSVFERVQLNQFTGREWLIGEVDQFLRNHDRGLFVIEADAGIGKTAFLAHLVKSRGYIHHFVEQAPGIDGIALGLRNLAAQLIRTWELDPYLSEGVLPKAATRPQFLQDLILEAAKARDHLSPGEKIVIVADALDEAGTPYAQNVLGLPRVLPEGVYLIVSHRPIHISLEIEGPRRVFRFDSTDDKNLRDMQDYLQRVSNRPTIFNAITHSGITKQQFVDSLLQKCNGLWVYLKYIIGELELEGENSFDLTNLPDGLIQYYIRYWLRWRDTDELAWDRAYLPTLTSLAAIQDACSLEQLMRWSGISPEYTSHLRRMLKEHWRAFVTITNTNEGVETYRFYHATLREFFSGQAKCDDRITAHTSFLEELAQHTHQTHLRIASHFLKGWGGFSSGLSELENAYPQVFRQFLKPRQIALHGYVFRTNLMQ